MSFDAGRYAGVPVLVTGASGFIGRWVARHLTAAGADLTLAVRNPAAMHDVARDYGIQGRVTELGLESAGEVFRVVNRVRPAITFNLAGYGVDRAERDPEVSHRVNILAVGWLAEAVEAVDVPVTLPQRLIHVGSALEYGDVGGNLDETQPGQPSTMYGRDKLAGTETLRRRAAEQGLGGLTARLFTVYGPGEHPGRLLPSLITAAMEGRDVPLSAGMQLRDFTYVGDVAEGLLRLGLSPAAPGSVLNLATGRLQTVRAFVEIAASVLEIPRHHLRFGALPVRDDEIVHERVTIERLRAALTWHPSTPVADGVRATWEFERERRTPVPSSGSAVEQER